jgi:hypothetical protein
VHARAFEQFTEFDTGKDRDRLRPISRWDLHRAVGIIDTNSSATKFSSSVVTTSSTPSRVLASAGEQNSAPAGGGDHQLEQDDGRCGIAPPPI